MENFILANQKACQIRDSNRWGLHIEWYFIFNKGHCDFSNPLGLLES